MEYLNEKGEIKEKIGGVAIDDLKKDGKLTKVKPQMASFRLYTKPPKDKKEDKKKKDSKKEEPKKEELKESILKKEKEVTPPHKRKFSFGMVSLTDKMMFMDNMSTMLRAGLALSPALRTLKKEIKNKYFRDIVDYLEKHVENGQLLSKGMLHYPKVFPEMIVATVEVGENTGMLADTFGHLADIMKRQRELNRKVVSAMMYPSIVILALIAVSLFLAMVIFPQLVSLFEGAGVELPFVLKAVNWFNAFIRSNGLYVLGGLVVFLILLKIFFNLPKPKLILHSFILKLPFIGKINQELALTRLASNLNALLSAGLAIVQSMDIVAKTLGNMRYKNEVIAMAKELEKGVSLEKTMSSRPKLFPSLTIQLCEVGETTGQLEEILGKIAKFYEDRVNAVMTNLSTILEPVLLVLVGVAVGFIAVSVIGPMYELTNSFGSV